jgi:hypothetical protein
LSVRSSPEESESDGSSSMFDFELSMSPIVELGATLFVEDSPNIRIAAFGLFVPTSSSVLEVFAPSIPRAITITTLNIIS